jgi:hypothetical protein
MSARENAQRAIDRLVRTRPAVAIDRPAGGRPRYTIICPDCPQESNVHTVYVRVNTKGQKVTRCARHSHNRCHRAWSERARQDPVKAEKMRGWTKAAMARYRARNRERLNAESRARMGIKRAERAQEIAATFDRHYTKLALI